MASHTSEVSDLVARHPSASQSKKKVESTHTNSKDSNIISQTNKVQWGIDWRVPTTMAGLLVSGVLLATVHHILYHALDGKTARSGENIWDIQDQAWSIRFGTAIALLAKTWLAGAVTMAYQQQIWMNFRCADYTVGGIGSMLAALGDCFSFFNWELLARAKIAMGLALVVW